MEDSGSQTSIPILDLAHADRPTSRSALLQQLHSALFDVGFLYVKNHGVSESTISNLVQLLPALFALSGDEKAKLSKLKSPHFLGYSGFAEEVTSGKSDLREQFDFATELPVLWQDPKCTRNGGRDHSGSDLAELYWRLRGPNQFPSETALPGFRRALTEYHDAVQDLSYRFVNLVEEAFGIPVGTFDEFWTHKVPGKQPERPGGTLPPQHRIKLVKYPPHAGKGSGQGVGAHKDSSGWLTFLHQVGTQACLEVLGADGEWIVAPPISGTFVVNFGNAFEAATEGAVKATVHRVNMPPNLSEARYSIPFFQGLPLDLTVEEIRSYIPVEVRALRGKYEGKAEAAHQEISSFLDVRWNSLGESQLRKWIRSHPDVARKWYDEKTVEYYLS